MIKYIFSIDLRLVDKSAPSRIDDIEYDAHEFGIRECHEVYYDYLPLSINLNTHSRTKKVQNPKIRKYTDRKVKIFSEGTWVMIFNVIDYFNVPQEVFDKAVEKVNDIQKRTSIKMHKEMESSLIKSYLIDFNKIAINQKKKLRDFSKVVKKER